MDNRCIFCGGPAFILRTPGDRVYVSCRRCGTDQSQETETVELDLWEDEEEDNEV